PLVRHWKLGNGASRRPLSVTDAEAFSGLAVDRVGVVLGYKHAVLDPCPDDFAALWLGPIGTVALYNAPRGALGGLGCVRIALAVGHASFNLVERCVRLHAGDAFPRLWRVPRNDR